MKNKRIYYLDLLRIIAICAVVMIHTGAEFVVGYNNTTTDFILGNIFDSISRMGVPLFLMISGALALNEEREFNPLKNILRLIFLFFIWSFIYSFIFHIIIPLLSHEAISFGAFFSNLFKGHYHLWYIFAIIGLYLLTPILRSFVNKNNKKLMFYFITLLVTFQLSMPIIQLAFQVTHAYWLLDIFKYYIDNLGIRIGAGLIIYYLAGWYIASFDFSKKTSKIVYLLGVLGITAIILLTQFFPKYYVFTYSNSNFLVFFYSIAMFLLVKQVCNKKETAKKFVANLSNLAFGVYVIHVIILFIIQKLPINNGFCIPIVWLLSTIVSFGIAYVLSKIPVIKKIIKA